jgi:hypothetical protein
LASGAVAAALLMGCNAKPTNQAAANTAPPAPVDTVITPAQFPVPKAGYWAETTVSNGGTPNTRYECEKGTPIDTSDMAQGCASLVLKHLADGDYTLDAKCYDDGYTETRHITFHGDPNANLSLDASQVKSQPGEATTTTTVHEDAHFAGPCPSD